MEAPGDDEKKCSLPKVSRQRRQREHKAVKVLFTANMAAVFSN